MVGVKKLVLDREALKGPVIDDLLKQYSIVEISAKGSAKHLEAGLVYNKVLVRTYGKQNGPVFNCPKCGSQLVLVKASSKRQGEQKNE